MFSNLKLFCSKPSLPVGVMQTLGAVGLVAAIGLANPADAAIMVQGSANDAGNAASSTISSFSLGAGNALAVLVASETGDPTTHSVTFDGNAITNVVTEQEGNQRASIFYAVNPSTTSGDITVTFDQSGIYAVTAVSLSNVGSLGDSGTFGEPDSNLPYDIDYNGTAGGFVLASFTDNAFNGSALTIAGDNINDDATDDYFQRIGGNYSASAGRALAGAPIVSDGLFTETFTDGGNSTSTRNAGALAAFVAVPEPSSLALLGLGGLAMLHRRRRQV